MWPRGSLLCLSVLGFLSLTPLAVGNQLSSSERAPHNALRDDWIQVGRGERSGDFAITSAGRLEYKGRLIVGADFSWTDLGAAISPVVGGRYAIGLPRTDGDRGEVYLLDLQALSATSFRLPVPSAMFVSWSPNLARFALVSVYESQTGLHIGTVASRTLRTATLPLTRARPLPETRDFDVASARWVSENEFRIGVEARCDRYADVPCVTPQEVVRRYDLSVDLSTLRAAEVSAPVSQVAAPAGASLSLAGIWEGDATDESGPGALVLRLAEARGIITGQFKATDLASGISFEGSVTGSLSGTTLTFRLAVARGSLPRPSQSCEVLLSGRAQVSATEIRGTYMGSSCGRPVRGGQLTLLRK